MTNERSKEKQGVHPLLSGGQPTPGHRLSGAKMEALTAICDTLFPSLEFDDTTNDGSGDVMDKAARSRQETIQNYFRLSASEGGVPLEAAGYMTKLLKRSQLQLINWSLWLFATRFGTLLLGGHHAITRSFPFISNFAGLSEEKRQKVLLGLSRSWLYVWQELFRFFKCFICWIIFSKVDKNGENWTFEAIGYKVDEAEEAAGGDEKKQLDKRVVDGRAAGASLGAELAKLGLEQVVDVSALRALRRQRGGAAVGTPPTEVGIRCDAVVLGSGSGGAVVAATLAQAGYRVVVLEKGSFFKPSELSNLEGPTMYATYEESGCLVTDDSRIILLAGATVGGGSTINWSAALPTPRHVRREWARGHQLEMFESATYDGAMAAVCGRLGVQPLVEKESFQNGVLRRGCARLDYHVDSLPRNSPPDHHCGFCGLGCKQNKKQGAIQTWLEDAAASGASLVSNCHAQQVLTTTDHGGQRRRAVGVVAQVDSPSDLRVTLYVEAPVVVAACGALRTPPLLKRSGLRNPAIGRNLHIHPVQVVWGYFPEDEPPTGQCFRGGIMTAYSKVAANWETTGYGALIQCPASHPGVVAIGTPWISGSDFKKRMQKFARTACFIVLTRDQGGGEVDEDEEGRLCVRYKISEADKESSREGAEKGLRIIAAAGASEVGCFNNDGAIFSPKQLKTEASGGDGGLERFLSEVRSSSFQKLSTIVVSAHQMGSCRMGVNPSSSAVDQRGQTWEVDGLFVADTSVFPTASGVNPMITVQSIAYCTAHSILNHLRQHHPPPRPSPPTP